MRAAKQLIGRLQLSGGPGYRACWASADSLVSVALPVAWRERDLVQTCCLLLSSTTGNYAMQGRIRASYVRVANGPMWHNAKVADSSDRGDPYLYSIYTVWPSLHLLAARGS